MKKRVFDTTDGIPDAHLFDTDDVPYFVDSNQLRALGVDPDQYLKSGSHKGGGWAGYMLDRKKDAALIERLQTFNEPHETVQ